MMEAHPEDGAVHRNGCGPFCAEIGWNHIETFLSSRVTNGGDDEDTSQGTLRAYTCTHVKNFKYIKHVLHGVDDDLTVGSSKVDGILIDLGMSSMQVRYSVKNG
ncbi:hypothetical protein ABZP36_024045 [Zizania latifolia]